MFLRYFSSPLTWIQAEEVCRAHFGHLVRGNFKNILRKIFSNKNYLEKLMGNCLKRYAIFKYLSDASGNEQFVHDFMSDLNIETKDVWIGLYQSTPSDTFRWV